MPAHPVYDSETEGHVYHVVPDVQPYDVESVSGFTSETESSTSGMTILSDDIPEFFIEHHGRQQPASENAVRWYPMDDTRRYIVRHVLRKYMLGNNYLGPVRDILYSDSGTGKNHHVLEIPMRNGSWIQEMATEFPHVQFRSLDIAPIMAHTPRSNIIFEVYDIGEGLLLEDNSQDIVFINVAIELVKDYRALLREVHRVLRPGGLIHLIEYVPGLWDPRDITKIAWDTNPVGCHLHDLVRKAISKLGVDPDMADKLPLWLAPKSDLWKGNSHPRGFQRIHSVIKTCPAYPHDGHPCSANIDHRVGSLFAYHYAMAVRDSLGLLCDGGMGEEEANSLVEGTIEELKDPEKCTLLKLYTLYAIKRD